MSEISIVTAISLLLWCASIVCTIVVHRRENPYDPGMSLVPFAISLILGAVFAGAFQSELLGSFGGWQAYLFVFASMLINSGIYLSYCSFDPGITSRKRWNEKKRG